MATTICLLILHTSAGIWPSPAHAQDMEAISAKGAPFTALSDEDIAKLSWEMFWKQGPEKQAAIKRLVETGDKSVIPSFVMAMRWTRNNIHVAKGLSELAGEEITDWHDAYVWQERNPQIIPHPSFRQIKLRFLENTDRNFLTFFAGPLGKRENMKIRLEEISWGGALFDKIPSLDSPNMIPADEADYLLQEDLVFGISINGDVRAYPLRIMGWHEMMNDRIGGTPVALAYCTLCGSGILFETGGDKPIGNNAQSQGTPHIFGSSGLLYRSNKLMFDRATHSLWNQFTGKAVVGPLAETDTRLNILPMSITTWKQWKSANPDTTVLSLETGYFRNYDSGFVYRQYFASPDLMFPAAIGDESLVKRKEYVFGIRQPGASRAWPLDAFAKRPIIHDTIGILPVILIGNAETRTVRAYERATDQIFQRAGRGLVDQNGNRWELREEGLVQTSSGKTLPRLPGHISYWFAWDNHLGIKSTLYSQ